MKNAGVARIDRLDRIGLALYTVRAEADRDFAGAMRQIAEIGYRELDMYIYASTLEPAATRARLDAYGLECVSSRVTTVALYRGWEKYVEAASTLGSRYITLANLPSDERQTARDWHELAKVFNGAGRIAKSAGLAFCYHNHSFEFTPLEGEVPYEVLLAETDPSYVLLQMDVYWMTHAGRDVATEIRRLAGRVATLHLKDLAATADRGITTVGRGSLDFPRILAAADQAGIRHVFVEEDEPKPPVMDAARAAYTYLRGVRW